jgi:hypothetical protein
VDAVTVWLDNPPLALGGVKLPVKVLIGENNIFQTFTISTPISGPAAYTFSGLDLVGNNVQVEFVQANPTAWVMVGEVSFDGQTGVPEPGTWLLLSGGLVAVGLLRRKRRN